MSTQQSEWSTGMCDWCGGENGCLTCLLATCVPCVQHGLNAEKLEEGSALCTGNFACACLSWLGMAYLGVPCIIQMSTRGAIRKKYNIPGSDFEDCCFSCWCGACDLCQQHYQLTGPHNKTMQHAAAVPPGGKDPQANQPAPYPQEVPYQQQGPYQQQQAPVVGYPPVPKAAY